METLEFSGIYFVLEKIREFYWDSGNLKKNSLFINFALVN